MPNSCFFYMFVTPEYHDSLNALMHAEKWMI